MKYTIKALALFGFVLMVGLRGAQAEFNLNEFSIELGMNPQMTIGDLKGILSQKLGEKADDITLTLAGVELEDDRKLDHYDITAASVIDYIYKFKEPSTIPSTYFGLDANDEEAVRQKQRELSEEKFKELFGEDVHLELDRQEREHEHKHKEDGRNPSIKDAFKWIYGLFKRGDKPPASTSQPTVE